MIVDFQYTKHQRYIYFSIPSNRFSLLTQQFSIPHSITTPIDFQCTTPIDFQKIMNELNLERPYTIGVYWNPRHSWCMKLKPIVGYTEIDSWTPRFLAWYTENFLLVSVVHWNYRAPYHTQNRIVFSVYHAKRSSDFNVPCAKNNFVFSIPRKKEQWFQCTARNT